MRDYLRFVYALQVAVIARMTPDSGSFRFVVPPGLPQRSDYFLLVAKSTLMYFSEFFSITRGLAP